MQKQLKISCLVLAFASLLGACKKNDNISKSNLPANTSKNGLKVNSGADGKWDLLGYGYDVTGNMIDAESTSDAPIIDVQKFATDYAGRIDVNNTTAGSQNFYTGATALDYLHDVNKKKGLGISGTAGNKDSTQPFFNFSVNRNTGDQNTTIYSSKYSYSTFESFERIKRIRFTGDATTALLMQYLTPEFINNVATLDADALVKRYGTHVLLDISLGGRLRLDYSANIITQTDNQQKSSSTKVGLGVNVLKIFGVNLNSDKSTEEINKITNESRSKQYTLRFYGGTNSGRSVSFDSNGNATETLNIASWEQSINVNNCALVDIGNAIPLSEFIADPTKKSQVVDAIGKYIQNRQIKELGEIPIYSYYNQSTGANYLTTGNSGTVEPGYTYAGVFCYGFKYSWQEPYSNPLYSYYNATTHDRYYRSSHRANTPDYVNEGILFYTYTTAPDYNRTPYYEYYNYTKRLYYYTDYKRDIPGYTFLQLRFYAINKD